MPGAIFIETLRQNWKQMLGWGVGLSALAALVVVMVPLFDMQDMKSLLESFPPFILALAGIGQDMEVFATNEGFVAIGFFGKSALIFVVYPVVMGMRITADEEDKGIMDVLLSLPVPRAQTLLEKFAAHSVSIVGVVVLIYAGVALGASAGGVDLDIGRLTEVTFYLVPLMVFVMAATMFVAAIMRRRTAALGAITAFVVASYMIHTIGLAAEGTVGEPLAMVSFFAWYNAGDILREGFIWPHIAGYVGLSVALVLAALYRYERRDVGI